jgi:hypothetical protein
VDKLGQVGNYKNQGINAHIRKVRHNCFSPFPNLFIRKVEKQKNVCTYKSYVVGLKKWIPKYSNISVKQVRKSTRKLMSKKIACLFHDAQDHGVSPRTCDN